MTQQLILFFFFEMDTNALKVNRDFSNSCIKFKCQQNIALCSHSSSWITFVSLTSSTDMTFSLFLHMFDFLFSLETSAFLPPTILTSIWIFKGNGSYLAYSGL